jgi:hypothetical protein
MKYENALPEVELAEHARFFHDTVMDWLREPDITVACGRWSDGAISELVPKGKAHLLPAQYDGCFAGVRELRLEGAAHHLHIDFGRVHRISYTVVPSVCLDFKPSFEARLLYVGPGGAPTDSWVVSLMLTHPYKRGTLNRDRVRRFLDLAREHARQRPDLVEFNVDPSVRGTAEGSELLTLLREISDMPGGEWSEVVGAVVPVPARPARDADFNPHCVPLLEEALRLPDASLVIYRERTLVEFKTEKLDGVHRYVEQGHVSWQIGGFHDHHCHLALGAVDRVLFSAEPVSCQGGGLNYTVWFLTAGPSGNPFRRDGYFSITLNRPYKGNQPRMEVITPVHDLYRRFSHEPWVESDPMFLKTLEGIPSRERRTREPVLEEQSE